MSRSLKIAGVGVRSSSRTSTSTRNPRSTPGHPHSTRKSPLWRSDTPTVAAISGTASAPQAFRGDASSRNEESGKLASCLLAGGMLFRPLAIRYDVFPGHRGCDTPGSQKAPSAKRCIKTRNEAPPRCEVSRQKAPSAKRCIKTDVSNRVNQVSHVRKHRAPKGALRLPGCEHRVV